MGSRARARTAFDNFNRAPLNCFDRTNITPPTDANLSVTPRVKRSIVILPRSATVLGTPLVIGPFALLLERVSPPVSRLIRNGYVYSLVISPEA